ncbi:hypothetical protein [Shewanella waksmanii]|uniref:hypothetical protein n=1 Tax=Shewanella waksmanii TaxID=213783 RepID=UPI0037366CB7
MQSSRKFVYFSFVFLCTLFATPVIGYNFHELVGYWVFLIFVIELPIWVLLSKDTITELNNSDTGSKFMRVTVRVIASLPSLSFGLLALCIGIAIVLWVLYNLLIETQSEYSGSLLIPSFGIAPLLIYWGFKTVKHVLLMRS